jgi:hypothetical protein
MMLQRTLDLRNPGSWSMVVRRSRGGGQNS